MGSEDGRQNQRREKLRIGVIADDLTGANDTAIQFAKYGLRSLVLVDLESTQRTFESWSVIVLNTDSRADSPDAAYEKVKDATRILRKAGIILFYKKIDSTLRGNVGTELDAVMDELNADLSFVVPSFPATGRTTLGGFQLVHGKLLENTEVASDPLSPIANSHVPTIVSQQSRRKTAQVGLNEIRRSLKSLSDRVAELKAQGFEILVFDTATQEDMNKIANLCPEQHDLTVQCGSAGFAEELAKNMTRRKDMPTLVIAGSLSQVTRGQVDMLRLQPKTRIMELDLMENLKAEDCRDKMIHEIIEGATRHLSEGYDLVIRPKMPEPPLDILKAIPPNQKEDSVTFASKLILLLGRTANDTLKKTRISGLILTGGDTAKGVCQVMGIEAIEIDEEVRPGIPTGIVLGGENEGLRIVTKAGSFGEEDALVESVRFLKQRYHAKMT